MSKVLLMILDGWGIGRGDATDGIAAGNPEKLRALASRFPHAELRTDGEAVGLPAGQMGNSEVGHLNIGAGRVLYQDLVRINRAAESGELARLPEMRAAIEHAKAAGGAFHVMGLLSDGGVHSHRDHLYAILRIAKAAGLEKVYVHAFTDGRDTDPKSGAGYVAHLMKELSRPDTAGELVSLVGRYYAMDRDKRWERIAECYDLLVNGRGEPFSDPVKAMEDSYAAGLTDEFLKPHFLEGPDGRAVGRIKDGDTVVFINFRNDRAKELTYALTQQPVPGTDMKPLKLWFATMVPYDPTYAGLHVIFPKENVVNTIGEWVAKKGLKQLRIAETEKYAHVTFFLNGGREKPYEGEERILVPSPKVATYDLKPEMSAPEVTEKLRAALAEEKFDFICLNFANGDMVGHTGVFEAIKKAVKTIDECAASVIETARAHGYEVVQIADHGNADHARNDDGTPNTAHSLNPVPIMVVSDRVKAVKNGVLADVAPTVLALMGIEKPAEMTGKSLAVMK
jgi:2,3-bisphosphoglycerate-independent phosphoglycerate mutase